MMPPDNGWTTYNKSQSDIKLSDVDVSEENKPTIKKQGLEVHIS